MQELILTKAILYAPTGILLVLILLVPILAANLRQMKKMNKKLSGTLGKAEDYFQYILEEEETETEEAAEVRPVNQRCERSTKKAEDAALIQEVLTEYFS